MWICGPEMVSPSYWDLEQMPNRITNLRLISHAAVRIGPCTTRHSLHLHWQQSSWHHERSKREIIDRAPFLQTLCINITPVGFLVQYGLISRFVAILPWNIPYNKNIPCSSLASIISSTSASSISFRREKLYGESQQNTQITGKVKISMILL